MKMLKKQKMPTGQMGYVGKPDVRVMKHARDHGLTPSFRLSSISPMVSCVTNARSTSTVLTGLRNTTLKVYQPFRCLAKNY